MKCKHFTCHSCQDSEVAELVHERNEAQARVIDAALIHAELVRERDEARALNAEWAQKAAAWMASPDAAQRLDGYRNLGQQVAEAQRERDEARAEAERWKASLKAFREDYWAEGNRWLEKAHARAEEAETELNRLRSFAKPWEGDAYRRGAEAMREACAREAAVCANHRGEELDAILSALPIPEEP